MRPIPGILLGLLVLTCLPPAKGQDALPGISLTVDPFPAPARPLLSPATTNVTVRVSCPPPGETAAQTVEVALRVSHAPDWAVTAITPRTLHLPSPLRDPNACKETWTGRASLIVSATDRAPARTPAPVQVEAILEGVGEERRAMGDAQVEASFFGLLQAWAPVPAKEGPPGDDLVFPVWIRNLGNGATTVHMEAVNHNETWNLTLPDPFTVKSAQQGGTPTQVLVDVVVLAPELPEDVGTASTVLTLKLHAWEAAAPENSIPPDTVQLLATATREGYEPYDVEALVREAPGLPAFAVAGVLAAMAAALTGSRSQGR